MYAEKVSEKLAGDETDEEATYEFVIDDDGIDAIAARVAEELCARCVACEETVEEIVEEAPVETVVEEVVEETVEEPAVEEPTVDVDGLIDTFNETADAFDLAANAINEDIDAYPQELIDVMNELADGLLEIKETLEGDTSAITEEAVEQVTQVLNDTKAWADDVYANLDTLTIEATTVDTSREAVVEAFNYVSERFNAVSAVINEDIESYDDEFIEGMILVAEGLNEYQALLASDAELAEEDAMLILEDLLAIDEWVTSFEEG